MFVGADSSGANVGSNLKVGNDGGDGKCILDEDCTLSLEPGQGKLADGKLHEYEANEMRPFWRLSRFSCDTVHAQYAAPLPVTLQTQP